MQPLKFFFMITALLFSINIQADTLLHAISGEDIQLSSLKGKWVFINYWASWCQPCLDEISEFNRFYEHHKNENIAVFAVNYDDLPTKKLQRLIKKFNIRYPSISSNELDLGEISVVPITFVLNPAGELSTTLYGGQTVESLNDVITHG